MDYLSPQDLKELYLFTVVDLALVISLIWGKNALSCIKRPENKFPKSEEIYFHHETIAH